MPHLNPDMSGPLDYDALWPSEIEYEHNRATTAADVMSRFAIDAEPFKGVDYELVCQILKTWDTTIWPEDEDTGALAWETYMSLATKGFPACYVFDEATILAVLDEREQIAVDDFFKDHQESEPPLEHVGELINWIQANFDSRPPRELLGYLAHAQEKGVERDLPRIHNNRANLLRKLGSPTAHQEISRAIELQENRPDLCYDYALQAKWRIEDGNPDEAHSLFARAAKHIEQRLSAPNDDIIITREGYQHAIDGLIELVKLLERTAPEATIQSFKREIISLRAKVGDVFTADRSI